jgi:chromosomal replication initiator protein
LFDISLYLKTGPGKLVHCLEKIKFLIFMMVIGLITTIWEEFLKIIRQEAGSRVVDTWFKAVSLQQWDAREQVIYLQAPNVFVKNWIQEHYLSLLQIHLERLLNVSHIRIIFIEQREDNKPNPAAPVPIAVEALVIENVAIGNIPARNQAPMVKNAAIATTSSGRESHVQPSYSFDNFVIGPSNSLSYAAAYAVTERPGKLYNPLFIYGGSWLGKTHLLHAIGNEIKVKNKESTILYQTADRFVNEFINAIRFDKVHKFQVKYQSIDVLLIDDIQFISNKEQTQEAFFHIFNSLYEARKQIVFSSDMVPHNMNGIAERLRSRLASGLVTDMHVPRLETKIAILKKKAEMSGDTISDEVAHFIASRVTSNIRELEGALIRVMAFSSLTQQAITLDLAKKVLVRSTQDKRLIIDFQRIVSSIKKHYSYDLDALCSKNRNKELAFVRQVAMFLMKRLTDKSLRDIGSFLGGRNHATVMHALNKIEKHAKQNADFQFLLKQIEEEMIG